MITFLICGFWHGANWNFIIFGGLHGFYLSFPIIFKKTRNKINQFLGIEKLPRANYFFQILISFALWCFSLIFFRSIDLSEAFLVIKNIFTANQSHPFLLFLENANSPVDFGLTSIFIVLLMIVYMFLVEILYSPNFKELNSTHKMDIAFLALTLSLTIGFGVFNETSFIYFQF
jgi:D-alanyl-lipoteichoic acid acyltransferase DltB (MBOAT superfamily)